MKIWKWWIVHEDEAAKVGELVQQLQKAREQEILEHAGTRHQLWKVEHLNHLLNYTPEMIAGGPCDRCGTGAYGRHLRPPDPKPDKAFEGLDK